MKWKLFFRSIGGPVLTATIILFPTHYGSLILLVIVTALILILAFTSKKKYLKEVTFSERKIILQFISCRFRDEIMELPVENITEMQLSKDPNFNYHGLLKLKDTWGHQDTFYIFQKRIFEEIQNVTGLGRKINLKQLLEKIS
jgi:hypothetical protein